MPERSQTVAQLLGYADDARLLIINADDFGMSHAENAATIAGLEQGAFCSATIMVPCPWFAEVVAFARRMPDADLGVRLGILSPDHFWFGGPRGPEETVTYWTNLLRNLPPGVNEVYVHAALDEPEMRALSDAWVQRVADYEFFTAPSTRVLLRDLGITLVGYRALRTLQRQLRAC